MLTGILIQFIPVVIAIVIHEVAHGWVACWCGDDTAKRYGRLSLNPLRHIDVFGTIILPVLLLVSHAGFLFGWAKPVPVNYTALRHPRRDVILVAAAGIVANLLLAGLCAFALKLLPAGGLLSLFLINLMIFNIVLAVFNALPVPPLDGSKILLGWSDNPHIIRFLNAYRGGTLFIIAAAFILPVLLHAVGIGFNPFAAYLGSGSRWLLSLFL